MGSARAGRFGQEHENKIKEKLGGIEKNGHAVDRNSPFWADPWTIFQSIRANSDIRIHSCVGSRRTDSQLRLGDLFLRGNHLDFGEPSNRLFCRARVEKPFTCTFEPRLDIRLRQPFIIVAALASTLAP